MKPEDMNKGIAIMEQLEAMVRAREAEVLRLEKAIHLCFSEGRSPGACLSFRQATTQ